MGLLTPDAIGSRKHIDHSDAHRSSRIACRHRERIAPQCHMLPKDVRFHVRGFEIGLLCPHSIRPREYVDGSRTLAAVISLVAIDPCGTTVFVPRTHGERVLAQGNTEAKLISSTDRDPPLYTQPAF